MDDRLSGTDHGWFEYFPNAIKSVMPCRSQNVLRVVRYAEPADWTSCRRAFVSLWTYAAHVLWHEAASFLLRLVRISVEIWHRPDDRDRLDDVTDGGDGDGVKCEVLYDPGPGRALVDVVFIHGLRGDRLKTWKQGAWPEQPEGSRCPEPVVVRSGRRDGPQLQRLQLRSAADERADAVTDCWPRDWLPLDCPHVRVIAISYSTDPYLWRPVWLRKPIRTTMRDRGLEMISLLRDVHVGLNPITWVGHSKGGLFIKQILVHANENQTTRPIITNTKRILFYSVPHNGSPLANIKLPFFQRSIELQELVNDTQVIQKLQKTFQEMMNCNRQIQVKSFIETKLTLMKLIYLRIVSIQSADPGFGDLYGVPLDHRNICKPKNRNCFLYKELVDMIHSLKQSTIEEAVL